MQPDYITVPGWLLMTLAVTTALGVVFTIGMLAASISSERAATAELSQRLQFEVEAIPPNLEPEYRKLFPMRPTLSEFAKAFLDNASYKPWHERVQAEVTRQMALHPCAALFVKVSRMP